MQNTNAKMPVEVFRVIIDKLKSEGYRRIGLFNWTEPFLARNLQDYVAEVKKRDLPCLLSTTLSLRHIDNLEATLLAKPDLVTVSVSGWDQATYQINHVGGDLSYVLANVERAASIVKSRALSTTYIELRFIKFYYNVSHEEPLRAFAATGSENFAPKLRFASAFDPKHNNFDLVRLIAAVTVLVSHAYPMSASTRPEIFDRIFGYGDGGSAAVAVFFVLSGFLIARSVERSTTTRFFEARILRIVPALLAVSVFEAFVIGPIFFNGPMPSYWPEAWEHLLNARVFGLRGDLPGVLASNPIPNYVNGSLWTLPDRVPFLRGNTRVRSFGRLTTAGLAFGFAQRRPDAGWPVH
jgi:hypothetical protein